MTDAPPEVIRMTAREAVARLRRRELSPLDLIDAALARIAAVEPAINALPTLCADRARDRARAIAGAREPPLLAGLPLAVKDLNDVAGVRTTYGSRAFADHVPQRSDFMVETLERNGGVVLAKSNTPEFGAGANTFNDVFGKTRNPWNTALASGGSSGGAAAALAAGAVWLATGSDLGGSCRVPASFCGVVGMRPSPGTVPRGPATHPFDTLWVEGPLARNVGDAALMLDAMAAAHSGDPLASGGSGGYAAAAAAPRLPARVGFSADLGGLPLARAVRAPLDAAIRRIAGLGVAVEDAAPDFAGAAAAFRVLRAALYVTLLAPVLAQHRDKLKPEVVANIEEGLKLTAADIGAAERARGALTQAMRAFFARHDLLLCPVAAVPPFDVNRRYVDEIEGRRLATYFDWFAHSWFISLTGCPALSLPVGFTADGLPVGLQLVAPPRGDAALLGAAAALEAEFGLAAQVPIDPRPAGAAKAN